MRACGSDESGIIYLWALFAVALAGVVMAGAAQVWQIKSQREKEAELLYVGEQFHDAIMSYYNAQGMSKEYPKTFDDLLQDKRSPVIKRHLRKIYVDPITNSTEWGVIDESELAKMTTTANSAAGAASNMSTNTNASTAPNQNLGATPGSAANPNLGAATGTNASTAAGSNLGTAMGSSLGSRIAGVYSLSLKKPVKKDKFPENFVKFNEAVTYQDWKFAFKPGNEAAGAAGQKSTTAKPGTNAPGASGTSPFSPKSQSPSSSNSPGLGRSPSTGSQQAPGLGAPSRQQSDFDD